MAEIKIQVNKKTGDVKILNGGGGGSACLHRTADLEKALGAASEESRTLTEEYFEENENVLTIEENG